MDQKKKDLKILWAGAIICAIVLIFNIDKTLSLINKITGLSLGSTTIDNIKSEEAEVWGKIKGTKTVSPQNVQRPDIPDQPIGNTPSIEEPINNPTVPVEPQKSLSTPFSALILGDSMVIEGFGPQLETKLIDYDVSVVRFGQYSTGLNRIDYYDWYTVTNDYITTYHPDILIFMIGANDGQAIQAFDGTYYQLYEDGWEDIYRERVALFLEYFADDVKFLYWVGHPIPRDTNDFYIKFQIFNRIYKEECAKYDNAIYINAWDRFAVNGEYAAAVADDHGVTQLVKGADGVHVTVHGGNILADLVITYMEKNIIFK
ncbi:DUF459 domain-containing protein [Candidatus Dojkabacteria bacterium]|nr:DUF459 domain-containing protein [Candidatus Dojkabacteria bacterium]